LPIAFSSSSTPLRRFIDRRYNEHSIARELNSRDIAINSGFYRDSVITVVDTQRTITTCSPT
jgi:hypothetical protein